MKLKLIIMLMLQSTILFANPICEKNLKAGWEKAMPFQFKDKDDVKGIDIDTLKAVMNEMHCKIIFKETPWERHLKEIEHGQLDIAAGANITPEREIYANFSIPYLTEHIHLYVIKKNLEKYKFKNEREMVNLNIKIGVIAGSFLGPEIEAMIKEKKLIKGKNYFEMSSEKQLVELLISGRIDGILLGEYVNNLHLDIAEHPQKMFEHNTNFMFSKRTVSKEFIKEFNNALKKLIENKTVSKIRDGYNNDNKAKY